MQEYVAIEAINAKELTEKMNALVPDGFVFESMCQSEDDNAIHIIVMMSRTVDN